MPVPVPGVDLEASVGAASVVDFELALGLAYEEAVMGLDEQHGAAADVAGAGLVAELGAGTGLVVAQQLGNTDPELALDVAGTVERAVAEEHNTAGVVGKGRIPHIADNTAGTAVDTTALGQLKQQEQQQDYETEKFAH